MIEGLHPYAEFVDSEERWIGRLPTSWALRRAKFLFREVDERSKLGREELLSVSHKTGVTPRSQKNVTMFMAESNVGHKVCQPDDLVINTLWAWMAALGVSRHHGIVSPAYGVYRPSSPRDLLPRFADQLLRTPAYAAEYRRRSTGVNSSRLRLYPEAFLRIPVILPPLEDQAAIVRFLDHVNRKIDGLIQAKRRGLSLITEMLLSITQESMLLRESETIRLSTAATPIRRPINRRPTETFTRVGLYNRGRGIFHKPPTVGAELGDSEFFWIRQGDLVISGQFAWEGAVALARVKDDGCVASHRYPILRGREHLISSAALLAILRTKFGGMLLDHHSRGAAGRNRPLNINALLKERVPIPPKAAQARIMDLLDQEYSVAQSVARSIELAQEYRTRLVADVVTGQLDVRAAAAKLPDLPEPQLAAEEETEDQEAVTPEA
jgi:type I restriction enzyme S subunit